MVWPLTKGLAGGRWLAGHINPLKKTPGQGQIGVAAPPDVVIALPESQCKVEDFVTGSIFRAANLRTAKLRRQAYLDRIRQEAAAARLQAEQDEAAARLQAEKAAALAAELQAEQELAKAMQRVRQLGPGIFVAPPQTEYNQQLLKAGNFKATLVFNSKLPHHTNDNGIARFALNKKLVTEHQLAIEVRDASWTARCGDPNAPGNLLIATNHQNALYFLEKDVSDNGVMDEWYHASPADMQLEGFQIPA